MENKMEREREEIIRDIEKVKKEKRAVILAHSYQPLEIQHIADYVGDSLGLCIQAGKTNAEMIVFCGVHFMAESAKLLNPEKIVLLPAADAGCPMAEMAAPEELAALKREHPGAVVICYVNSTAAVKAESDICCTSSNAVDIVKAVPREQEIIFVPDKHLGEYAAEQAKREILLWDGYCPVHQRITRRSIMELKKEHPEALVYVHPECPKEVRDSADFVGSTSQIFNRASASKNMEFIIGTEEGIVNKMREEFPGKEFHIPGDSVICKNMKKMTLQLVLAAMEKGAPEILLDSETAERALLPVKRMLESG